MMRGTAAHPPTIRAKYKDRWDRDWPFDNKYLRELIHEANSHEEVLSLMRDCHEFKGVSQ